MERHAIELEGCVKADVVYTYRTIVDKIKKQKRPKGRKSLPRCCECDSTIGVGENFHLFIGERETNREDHGHRDFFHTCMTCHKIREGLYCDIVAMGNLRDDVEHHLGVELV